MTRDELRRLQIKATDIRKAIIEMVYTAGSGHPGGSLSSAEIVTALYFHCMQHKPKEPNWPQRDRFVLCKGHAVPVLYGALALAGYFSVNELSTLRKFGSRLQGHPDRNKTPGLDASTGSIGQGLSIASGLALGAKMQEEKWQVFALLGDGDLNEGQTWEAAMFAAHYHLNNLVVIIDRNGLQVDGSVSAVMDTEPLREKWIAFGWKVREIDGHKIEEVIESLNWARHSEGNQPACIIAHTVKGKGVSFMENSVDFHGRAPNRQQYEQALSELNHFEGGLS